MSNRALKISRIDHSKQSDGCTKPGSLLLNILLFSRQTNNKRPLIFDRDIDFKNDIFNRQNESDDILIDIHVRDPSQKLLNIVKLTDRNMISNIAKRMHATDTTCDGKAPKTAEKSCSQDTRSAFVSSIIRYPAHKEGHYWAQEEQWILCSHSGCPEGGNPRAGGAGGRQSPCN